MKMEMRERRTEEVKVQFREDGKRAVTVRVGCIAVHRNGGARRDDYRALDCSHEQLYFVT